MLEVGLQFKRTRVHIGFSGPPSVTVPWIYMKFTQTSIRYGSNIATYPVRTQLNRIRVSIRIFSKLGMPASSPNLTIVLDDYKVRDGRV